MNRPRRVERLLVDIAMVLAFIVLYVLVLTSGQLTNSL
jgi:hypothetical protein